MAVGVGALLSIGEKVLDKVLPDPEARSKAKAELARMEQRGELKELEVSMSAILAEARSSDPWTSRARPSFLYVVYVMLLAAIPMGVVSAISPATATAIADGYGAWLQAIPSEVYTLFGAGYLGYAGARSWDKRNQLKAGK